MTLGPEDLLKYLEKADAEAELIPVDVETPTVEAAARAVKSSPDSIVKSLIFMAAGRPILVIAGGKQRVPIELLAGQIGQEPDSIRLAKPEEVALETGYDVGAVPPFGHIQQLTAYMDGRLLDVDVVYAGGGAPDHLVKVSPREILRLSAADVIKLQS
jgi:prolyl-tRNA editing enzyme YbaK/EbsC (Cys-tRNA(Pro) deacylase)